MGAKSISKRLIKKIISKPETAIEYFSLVYVNEHQLSIKRSKRNNRFIYEKQGKVLRRKSDIERINSLVIPPAWKDVKISHLHNGHLQAVGKDDKERKQYRYHPIWNKIRNQTKFYKMTDFGKFLPAIRSQIEKDLGQKDWARTKVLALVVKLMEETHIRIGNEQYAKRNKTYGLSTLRSKHLHLFKNRLQFEFVGKKGKKHSVTLKNKKLMRLVSQCEEIPGWELFQYYDEDGKKHAIESSMVNDYLQDITGKLFTAKDFRTWAATIICFETLVFFDETKNDKEIKTNILQAYDMAAKALGNTRNVCRKYYVHPAVITAYEQGKLHKMYAKVEAATKSTTSLSISEQTVLKLIKNYTLEV